jgi:glutathione S-transferase
MILYDYPRAPNPMRVNLFLNEKKIILDKKIVDLSKHENLKPKFLKLNPWGTLPFLIVKGQVISESIAICKYFEQLFPSPNLFGKSPLEQAKIEMYRRKIEFDGMLATGESFRNSAKAFKTRAFAGPIKIPQIPALVERGKNRTNLFFDFLDKTLKKRKYVSGNKFSIADIDAYVTLTFAKWIKIDGTDKRKNIKKWKDSLEKRKSFIKYFNLFKK